MRALLLAVGVTLLSLTARADAPGGLSSQTMKRPSGPASLTGLGESFSASSFTGTGQFSVPLRLPPAPLAPELSLQYVAGQGQGALGLSFDLPLVNIRRTTDKGFPRFDESDRFAVSGGGLNDELVFVVQEGGKRLYRLKNEGSFALFERDSQADQWTIRLPTGQTLTVGATESSRQRARGRTFRWWITRHEDRFFHHVDYTYLADAGYPYLDRITYRHEAAEGARIEVGFTYEARPQTTLDYRYGVPIRLTNLLSGITVSQGSDTSKAALLWSYELGYEQQSLFSLLNTVKMEAADGTAMPTLRFDYLGGASSPGLVTTMSGVPAPGVNALAVGTARLEDVTGDGLPDILLGETAGSYRYYRNVDGVRWAQSPVSLGGGGSPSRALNAPGVVLADMNGDGTRDVAYRDGQTWAYAPSRGSQSGVFQGFGPAVYLSKSNFSLDYELTDSDVRLIDFNRDGRTDVLRLAGGDLQGHMNLPGDRLEPDNQIGTLPIGVDWRDPRTVLDDFNGDGVLDLVSSEFNWNRSDVRIWYGTGRGAFERLDVRMTRVPLGNAEDMQFFDINGDGQTDLVRYSSGRAEYYLNQGDGSFSGKQREFYGIPEEGDTRLRLLADMNGNSTADLVWIGDDWNIRYLDFIREPFAGLISRVDNGLGWVTEIDYRSSTEYMIEAERAKQPWRTPMPHPVPVISELRTSDSLSLLGLEETTTRTVFQYFDGYYDGPEREFRGFARVRQTDMRDAFQETLITETYSHVGRHLESGVDQEALKGKPYLQITKDAQGKVYGSSETSWEIHWLCQSMLPAGRVVLPSCDPTSSRNASQKDALIALALPHAVLTGAWEKTTSPRYTAVETRYDAEDLPWGKASRTSTLGEVTVASNYQLGRGFSILAPAIGNDETIEEVDYLHSASKWLLGLPYEKRLLDVRDVVVAREQTFYDDNQAGVSDATTLSKGLPTANQSWLNEASGRYDDHGVWQSRPAGWVVHRTHYNGDGLPDVITDALGRSTRRAYDPMARVLPTLETVPVGTDSAPAEYSLLATYDPGLGVLTSATELNGLTTSYAYDGLGRVISITEPNRDVSTCYTYVPGNPISMTTIEVLRDSSFGTVCGNASTVEGYAQSFSFSDGSGKVRLTKSEADAPGAYVGAGWTRYARNGKEGEVYHAFFSDHAGFEAAPHGKERQRASYDGLGRELGRFEHTTEAIREQYGVAPGFAQTSLLEYAPFAFRAYSERELLERARSPRQTETYPRMTEIDGQGRAVRVSRANLNGSTREESSWSFGYDPRGLIIRVQDGPDERRYRHDSLGRVRQIEAGPLGSFSYDHDDIGNLTRRRSVQGKIVGVQYDRAKRQLIRREQDAETEGGQVKEYRWHYDAPRADFRSRAGSSALNVIGQVGWVEFPTGSTHYSYDAWGRPTIELAELWDPSKPDSTFEAQGQRPDLYRDVHARGWTYSPDGRVLEQTEGDPLETEAMDGLRTVFDYNRRSLLSHLQAGLGNSLRHAIPSVTYDANGDVLGTDSINGVRTCQGRNERRQLTRLVSTRTAPAVSPDSPKAGQDCDALSLSSGVGFQNLRYNWGNDHLLASVDDLSIDAWVPSPKAGQPPERVRPSLGADYRYDHLGQLIEADYHQEELGRQTYSYDARHNMVRREMFGSDPKASTVTNFHYGEGGHSPTQLSRISGSQTLSLAYNGMGQLEQYEGYDLQFDPGGHLRGAGDAGGSAYEFHYDQVGVRRISIARPAAGETRVERVVSAGFEIRQGEPTWVTGAGGVKVEVRKSKGVMFDLDLVDAVSAYFHGGGKAAGRDPPLPQEYLDLNGDGSSDFDALDLTLAENSRSDERPVGGPRELWTYYHTDLLGAATHVTDSQGELSSLQQYFAFGARSFSRGMKPVAGFAGTAEGLERGLGLMHMGVREYAPGLNRWISPDPLFLEQPSECLKSPAGCNLYGYAYNNPVSLVDPSGMEPALGQAEDRTNWDLTNKSNTWRYERHSVELEFSGSDSEAEEVLDRMYQDIFKFALFQKNLANLNLSDGGKSLPGRKGWFDTYALWGSSSYDLVLDPDFMKIEVEIVSSKERRTVQATTLNGHPLVGTRSWSVKRDASRPNILIFSTEAWEMPSNGFQAGMMWALGRRIQSQMWLNYAGNFARAWDKETGIFWKDRKVHVSNDEIPGSLPNPMRSALPPALGGSGSWDK